MSWIELFLLAVGLCFDTFAVSLCGGISVGRRLQTREVLRIILCFAVFQAGFAFAGWALGLTVSSYISRFDHWVAFVLLGYIGGKMIYEGLRGDDDCEGCGENGGKNSLLNPRQLVLLSVATSIDAIAVGISIAVFQMSELQIGVCIAEIFVCTALASLIGILGGSRLGTKIGSRSEILGGFILIAIGIKILVEHTL